MKTEDLIRKDKRYIWHPFTPMASWLTDQPLIIEKGKGALLVDSDGREYIDAVASLWTNVHGHGVKKINDALSSQLEKIAHSTLLGLGNVPSILFAEKLSSYLPGDLERLFYSDSGATSVEVALKLAYNHWHNLGRKEKRTFIRFSGAYHGDTIGSVSVGGIDDFHELFRPLLFDAPIAPYPFCYRCPLGLEKENCDRECFDVVEDIVQENANSVAGILIEPLVQGASGIRPAPEGFLSHLRKLCNRFDILLIVDEVATGFGRTGKMFACEHEQVVPDLMTMAKGISGGYLPLAATAVSSKVFDSFLISEKELRTFYHGHTYTGNPLACAAAIASLEIFESNNIIESLQPKINKIQDRMDLISDLEWVGNTRNTGLMCGIELVESPATKTPFDPSRRIGAAVCREARKHGVILRPLSDVVVIMPPLSISFDQIDSIFSALEKSIAAVLGT